MEGYRIDWSIAGLSTSSMESRDVLSPGGEAVVGEESIWGNLPESGNIQWNGAFPLSFSAVDPLPLLDNLDLNHSLHGSNSV